MKEFRFWFLKHISRLLIAALFLSCPCHIMPASATPALTSSVADNSYAAARERWKELLTGGQYDPSDETAQEMIQSRAGSAEYHWQRMNKELDRKWLFSDLDCALSTSNMTATYTILEDMAIAYQTQGGRLYRNAQLKTDLLSALDFMYASFYHERTDRFHPSLQSAANNWWDWEVGTPQRLNNIVILLYQELTGEQIERFMKAVQFFVPDPKAYYYHTDVSTGANRVSGALVCAIHGLNTEDAGRLRAARDALSDVFTYVSRGDGFYEDGSFIQHGSIPYTGGYGLGLISDLSELLYLLRGTVWEVNDPGVDHVYTWMYQSFEPFVNSGMMMDPVVGRQIARSYNRGFTAITLIQTVIMLSLSAPERMAADFKSMAKTWTLNTTAERQWREWKQLPTLFIWNRMCALAADESVALWKTKSEYRQFAAMDRPVIRRENYTFALSMSSERTANYEALYGENDQGWHTGDGMTYLYNADDTAYADAFWPTVDRYRLPGTTTCDKQHQRAEQSGERTGESQVGGVELDSQFGVSCMQLNTFDGIRAKKAWFLFGDEIVALGSDISVQDSGYTVETVVENRKLTEGSVFATQREIYPDTEWEETEQPVSWAHLASVNPKADIGYYFPDGEKLNLKRECRAGAWAANKPVQTEYLTLWKTHTPLAPNDRYAYVILPGISMKETAVYAEDPKVEIVENTDEVQAVKQTEAGLTGIVFWEDHHATSSGVTSNRKAVVMTKETEDEMTVSVSDPTQQNQGTIEIELDQEMESVAFQDARVKTVQLEPSVKIQVDVRDAQGGSSSVTLRKKGSDKRRLLELNRGICLSKSEGGWLISDHGRVQLRRWSEGLEAETAGMNPSGFEYLILSQSKRSWYKDHFLLSADQVFDLNRPLVAEMTFRLSVKEPLSPGTVQAAVRLRGNSGYAEIEVPVEAAENGQWQTLKFVLDPARGRLACVNNGSVTVFPLNAPEQPLDDLRLYLVTDPDGKGEDGKAPLPAAVEWEIDSLNVYELSSGPEADLEEACAVYQDGGTVLVSAAVHNADAIAHTPVFYAAIFDRDSKVLIDCKAVNLNKMESGARCAVAETLYVGEALQEELETRLFVWDAGSMRPLCEDVSASIQ